jgi:hypothetical protein
MTYTHWEMMERMSRDLVCIIAVDGEDFGLKGQEVPQFQL